jgi:glycosyltransferase involved in cell wall biosynthesis
MDSIAEQTPQMLSLVVPLYNEAESLRELYDRVSTMLAGLDRQAEIIFVDDGSTDGSFNILAELAQRDPRVRVVQFRRNYGKSAALAVGFRKASGEVVVTLDADLQDDPLEVPRLLARLDEGYDLVSGWKRDRHDPLIKRVTSKLFNWVTGWLTGVRLHDINCGLKAYRREVTETLIIYGQLHRFLPVLAQWEGFRVTELPVRHFPRKFGHTKFGASRFTSGFFDLITVMFLTRFTTRPLHLFGLAGLVSTVVGVGISAYLAYERLFFQKYLSNRPLLFLGILLIIVGVQFVSLGLIGEMITASRKTEIRYSVRRELGFEEEPVSPQRAMR